MLVERVEDTSDLAEDESAEVLLSVVGLVENVELNIEEIFEFEAQFGPLQ